MHYSNTLAMLEAQRDKQTIYLENVLELMQAVFADVKYQTGKLVEDCQIENMERLVANLSTVTGNILFIIRKREKEILSSESRYVATLEKVRTACDGYREKIEDLDKTIQQLQKLQTQQEQLLAQEESKNAAILELTQRTRQLQEQIDLLQVTNPETEASKLRQTIVQQEQLLKQLQDQFQADCIHSRELEAQCQQLSQQIDEQENQILRRTEALDAAKLQTEQLQQQVLQQREQATQNHLEREALEEESTQLREKLMELNVALDLQKTANQQFQREHLDRVEQELSEVRTREEADRQQLQESEQQLQQLKESYSTLNGELSLLKLTENSVRKTVAQEQEKLDAQKLVIEALEAQVREKATESTALMDREAELRSRVDEKNLPQIKAQIADNIAKLEQTLEQAKQDEESLVATSAQLEQAQQNRNRICLELDKCRSQTDACQQEYEALLAQYETISTPEHQQRMENMANRLNILKKLAQQLTEGTPCGQSFRMDQSVAAELDRAERTLQLLRQAIRQYAQCRQDALEK